MGNDVLGDSMKMNRFWICLATILSVSSSPVLAEENEATLRAQSAGYRAVFTCGGVFNGAKTLEQIEAHELTGIASDYAQYIQGLRTEVDEKNKRVSVYYDDIMPPRISQWRPHLGCVSLPVGARAETADKVVGIDLPEVDARSDDGRPWQKHAEVNGSSGNAALDAILDKVFVKGNYGRDQLTTAILIATPEEIIAERYIEGYTPTTAQRTWSVAKSIGASVVGAAAQKQLIDVNEKAGLESWSRPGDPRGVITIDNLLRMASGLDSNRRGNRTDGVYFLGSLVSDTATRTALEVPPGKRWKYANNDTMLALRALRERMANKDAYLKFPYEQLLYKIGMTHTKLETDWDGNFILSSQVWTTARDMTRLGVLHLQDGVWRNQDGEEERILPEGWVEYITAPSGPQPNRGGRGYGAQWWLSYWGDSQTMSAYAARGNRGQIIMVIPDSDLVIVRRGYDPSGGEGIKIDEFAADVVQALEK